MTSYKATCVCGASIDTDSGPYFGSWNSNHNAEHAERIFEIQSIEKELQ